MARRRRKPRLLVGIRPPPRTSTTASRSRPYRPQGGEPAPS
jgi:hypothetical protein